MSIKNKILLYFGLAKQIHEYFGYVEDWVSIPMEDNLAHYWMIVGKEDNGTCVHSHYPFCKKSIEEGKDIYSGPIYTQRFLPKWVYRGEELTMVCVDTQTDGNKFLMIFDNEKECKDENLKNLYTDRW
jgi:hypothetical protein